LAKSAYNALNHPGVWSFLSSNPIIGLDVFFILKNQIFKCSKRGLIADFADFRDIEIY